MADSPCRRALQINEIVRMICEESYRPTNLATTTKIFSDAALDVIWRDLGSLIPLVKCMPETVWEKKPGERGAAIYHLRRPITFTDLPRMLFYSKRVRRITVDSGWRWNGTLHSDFLHALDLALPLAGFMPLLSNFSWVGKKHLSVMRHFLGPQSRTIDLALTKNVAGLSILPYLSSTCPHLSDVTLDAPADTSSIGLISAAVCGWHHLTILSVPNLDKSAFLHVAQLPLLMELSLTSVERTVSLPHLPDFLSGSTFPALATLHVSCDTARFCSGLVRVISSGRLKALYIIPRSDWTTAAWQELHTTLRDHLNHNILDTLCVEQVAGRTRPDDTPLYVLSDEAMRPLLAFKKLTSVIYQISPGLDVDDTFLEEMAVEWRRIQTLTFNTDVFVRERPRATLRCLITFAKRCRRLDNLGIRIDASEVPEFIQVPGQRISHSLNALEVGTSSIRKDVEAEVAALVSNLFPSMEYLFAFSGHEGSVAPFSEYQSSWSRVSDMLPVFSAVREQEETFWTAEVSDEESGSEAE
ncbi:hypothetical protein C8R46DRAFT_1096574 [Mycena filopes]|nr:hypothetical protein C8R46DRAFT_1096574 [Mycena filopes]